MTFAELLEQVRELLQSKGRVSYRALKLQFNLDDEQLEGLKDELIEAERVAADEGGKVLMWVDDNNPESRARSLESRPIQSPKSQVQSQKNQTLDARRQILGVAAERRQLTVMFCDLVGSTALSTQLDPEELREVIQAYRETCAGVIRRFDGYLAKYIGDGLLVYFGYPTAHEDDAARAVRTGLEIVAAMQNLAFPTLRLAHSLQVRVGIHTGLVVAGEMGTEDQPEPLAIVGETPNLAARIQGQAVPNEVVISAATYRLVEGLFECEGHGQPELKGVSTPLTLYRVVRESEAQSRFEVVVRKGLMPLIGREHEYGLLRERWEQAKNGEGQVVLLSGEPGIGKSRLVEALKEAVGQEGASCLELRCSPYHQNSALYPVIAHLQRVSRFQSGDTSEQKLQKFVQALGRMELSDTHVIASPSTTLRINSAKQSLPEKEIASSPPASRNDTPGLHEAVPLLAALLLLPHPEGYPPITLSPQKQKERTQEALVAWLCAETKQQAVVYAWEDLHWADPSTLELLTLFLNQVPTIHLFAVLTFRPEFVPPWSVHSYLSQLTLSRLGRNHVEIMVGEVTGGKTLPKEIVQQIVSKTDGVPLFVEELTKSVLESRGATDRSLLQALDIPATLQDSLMARLDRLGPAKEVAQLGATIGREFDYALLRAVSPMNEEALQQGLKRLVEAELVYQSSTLPQARYLFKHALIQDSAYQSLLKSKRQQLHQEIAQVLKARFPETKDTQPEIVAHHYTEAGLIEQAIPYWQQAGQKSVAHSANIEAIAHLTKGLELLKTLPDTPERAQQELTLQLALGPPLSMTKGFAVPEVEHTYARARELCQQMGETPQLFFVLLGLYTFYQNQGELQTARELADQMMRLAQIVQDPHLLSGAHIALGGTLYWLGELASALPYVEQGIALYDPQQHPRQTAGPADLRVQGFYYASVTLWHLGYPDQALKRSREAVAVAAGLSRPFILAQALGFAALFHFFRREWQIARERAEAVMTLSTEQGFPFWLAQGTVVRGGALVEQGQVEEGIVQMQQGLAAFRALGSELARISRLPCLAAAYAKAGRVEEGLAVLAEALTLVEKNRERFSEAELYRLKGMLTLQQFKVQSSTFKVTAPKPLTSDPQAEAEAYFHKAIEIARKQQAKSLELRATVSLARLWQQQCKQKEAHQMLSEIYNWFTEGFDTKDLQEAKALLEGLASEKS